MASPNFLPARVTAHIFGSSVIGPLHVQMGLPCQDACAFCTLPSGFSVIAVADGLGSAVKCEIGAKLAVDAAVALAMDQFGKTELPLPPLGEIARASVHSARKALEQKAAEEHRLLRDLACTVIVVALHDGQLGIGHIGDGAVVAQARDGLRLLSGPGESEYANEVVPLTSTDWQKSLRVVPVVPDLESVAVFTDGCQRAAFRKSSDQLEPFEGFFGPIFSYARELPDSAEAEQEIRELLSSNKMCANSEDDKTLVVGVLLRK